MEPDRPGARAVLPAELRRRGAVVDEVIAYRAVPPKHADVGAPDRARGRVDRRRRVQNFVELLGRPAVPRLVRDGRPAIAIGPVTADTARAFGLPLDVVPERYTAAALAGALEARLGRR